MTLILTHSDISDYLRCRRLFRWSTVDDWHQPEPLTGALTLGTRVHAAIEVFHRTGQDPVEAHIDLAEAVRAQAVADDLPTWARDQLESDILVGTNCCLAYRRWVLAEDPYAGWTVADVERTVETPLLGGRVLLRGKIDMLLRNDDGAYYLEDWKTMAPTRSEAAQNFVLRTFQHAVYGFTLAAQDSVEVIGARYIHLKKVKDLSRTQDPVLVSVVPVMRRTTTVAMQYVQHIAAEILGLIDGGDAMVWYPSPGDSCSWCSYKDPCLLATDGREAEQRMLADKYQHGLRLARYGT